MKKALTAIVFIEIFLILILIFAGFWMLGEREYKKNDLFSEQSPSGTHTLYISRTDSDSRIGKACFNISLSVNEPYEHVNEFDAHSSLDVSVELIRGGYYDDYITIEWVDIGAQVWVKDGDRVYSYILPF